MDITQIYAVSLGVVFCTSIVFSGRRLMIHLWDQVSRHFFEYFAYSYLIRRHRFIGPLTPTFLLVHSFYIAANTFCLTFKAATPVEAATRAGRLSLINLFLPFAGLHLSFLADLTGMSLRNYKSLHRSTGLMSLLLALIHVLVMVQNRPFSPSVPEDLFGLTVRSLLLSPSLHSLRNTGSAFPVLSPNIFQRISTKYLLRDCSPRTSNVSGPIHVFHLASPSRRIPDEAIFIHHHRVLLVHSPFAVCSLLV